MFFFITQFAFSQDDADAPVEPPAPAPSDTVPLTEVFHEIGWNALGTFTYNYGQNFIIAGLGTYALVESGIDWDWRGFAVDHKILSNISMSAFVIGTIMPAALPLGMLLGGRSSGDVKMQYAALALTQSLALALTFQSGIKFISGRSSPHIGSFGDDEVPAGDFSRDFNWFHGNPMYGWPSGHTMTAVSAMATLAEIYGDKLWLQIAAYSYAAYVTLSVTMSGHWASDALAGALIGWAIGKTVGQSFNKLIEGSGRPADPVSFYAGFNTVGVRLRL